MSITPSGSLCMAEVPEVGMYSYTSMLVSFRPRQTWYSMHFYEKKKMFQRSEPARDSWHLLELV